MKTNQTTITVDEKTRSRLNLAKYTLGCKTINETINKILDITNKIDVSYYED